MDKNHNAGGFEAGGETFKSVKEIGFKYDEKGRAFGAPFLVLLSVIMFYKLLL